MVLEKLKRYLDKPLWVNRIAYYLLIFILVLSGFAIVLIIFYKKIPDFSIINNTVFAQYNTTELRNMGFFDNERYLISALVQSLAATIALVVSLSLIAIQFAAESHSSRIIEFYKRNPDMWILMGIYIIVIFYGLALLKVIDIGVADINMEIAIYSAYFLGFFAFICLIPYIWNTLNLLKISTAIKWLEEDITREKILEALKDSEDIIEKDPVQPIIDIMNSAFERNDYETVRNGLKVIKKNTIAILENPLEENEEKIIHYIIQHIAEFGIYGASKKKEIFVRDIINSLYEIGFKTIENEHKYSFRKVATAMGEVGERAAKNELEITFDIVTKLTDLIKEAIQREEFESSAQTAVNELKDILIASAENKLGKTTLNVVKRLEELWTQAIEGNLKNFSTKVAETLGYIGIKAIKENFPTVASEAVRILKNKGTIALEYEDDMTASWTIEALGNIGAQAAKNNLDILLKIVEILNNTAINLPKRKFGDVTWIIVKALENIGIKAIEESAEEKVLEHIINILEYIGIESSKVELEYNLKEIGSRVESDIGDLEISKVGLVSGKVGEEANRVLGLFGAKMKESPTNKYENLISMILLSSMKITCEKK
ncbi:DUF2254 family protein [Methanomethylovorans sp.]|uniref:DUF2254 family protein n=1 Tax=Methanomethylovorans sp. TaxID=2758717 RepID=UPI00345F11E9